MIHLPIRLAWESHCISKRRQSLRISHVAKILILLIAFEVGAQEKTLSQESAVSPWLDKSAAYFATGPDMILYNANVITMDDQLPEAEAIAIEGNLISAVGTDTDVLAIRADHTMLYDLEGRTIVPGLIDAHSHRLIHAFWNGGIEGLARGAEEQAADGYTTVHELGFSDDVIQAAQTLAAEGRLAVRIDFRRNYNDGCGEDNDHWMIYPYTEKKDTTLRMTGIKIFADGGGCFCSAITSVYQGEKAKECGEHGHLFRTQAEMNSIVDNVLGLGYPIAMHAIGDSAIGVGLNAFAAAFGDNGNTLRSRMEHVIVMREDLADQMASLGVAASIQNSFANATTAPLRESYLLPEVLEWAYPWRRMADRGIPILCGTDVAMPSQVMRSLSLLATRKSYAHEVVPTWMDGDQLTVEEGLRAMTVTNAWNVFEEEVKGTITPGKLADLTVLSENPLALDPFDVRNITIEMTIMDGIIRHNQMGVVHTAVHDVGAFNMGFDDRGLWGPHRSNVGLIYNDVDHLYMGTLLISFDDSTIATATPWQADYVTSFEGWVDYREPGATADEEVTVVYEDAAIGHPGPIRIGQETFMWAGEPYLLAKYTFTNIGDSLLADLYFGQYMDFDVVAWTNNMGGIEQSSETAFGYMYNASEASTPYIGAAMFDSASFQAHSSLLIVKPAQIESMEEPIFSKYMRSDSIGSVTPYPRDYGMLITSKPCDLPAGVSKAPFMLAFAVGNSLDDLKSAMSKAHQKYAELLDIDARQDQINPTEFALHQNYPNPFNPVSTIRYDLPKAGNVALIVYDILGRELARLVSNHMEPGYHKVVWDGRDATGRQVPSGIYIARIVAPKYAKAIKMLLLK